MNSDNKLNANPPKKKRKSEFFYDFVKVTAGIPALIWLRPKRIYPYGKPCLKGPLLILSNHRSLIDPITVLCAFPTRRLHSLATKDLFSTKLRTKFFTAVHCIVVDKENFSMSSFHEVVGRLKDGKAVVIFPEGSVNFAEHAAVGAFKSGVALMAYKGGAPVLPVYIAEKKKWYHRQHIVIGQPVDIRTLIGGVPSMDALTGVCEHLHERELELERYYKENYSRDTAEQSDTNQVKTTTKEENRP